MNHSNTERMELVETANLVNIFRRLESGAGGYDNGRWKRAVYHAVLMAGLGSWEERKAIREALRLP